MRTEGYGTCSFYSLVAGDQGQVMCEAGDEGALNGPKPAMASAGRTGRRLPNSSLSLALWAATRPKNSGSAETRGRCQFSSKSRTSVGNRLVNP